MKRKIIILSILLLLGLILSGNIFAESKNSTTDFSGTLALGLPNIGLGVETNDEGIVAVRGFNLGLGYSAKFYFEPARFDQFNFFWQWGTVALIIPYIGDGIYL